MQNATVTVGEFLDGVSEELMLFSPPPRAFLRSALSTCLTRLYAETIRRTLRVEPAGQPVEGRLPFSALSSVTGAEVREEDVIGVFCGDVQLSYLPPEKLGLAEGARGGYYTVEGEALRFSGTVPAGPLSVLLTERPPRLTAENEACAIPLPDEHLPLLRAFVLGEGCKAANEDALAAKWLSEYNLLLDQLDRYLEAARAARGRG